MTHCTPIYRSFATIFIVSFFLSYFYSISALSFLSLSNAQSWSFRPIKNHSAENSSMAFRDIASRFIDGTMAAFARQICRSDGEKCNQRCVWKIIVTWKKVNKGLSVSCAAVISGQCTAEFGCEQYLLNWNRFVLGRQLQCLIWRLNYWDKNIGLKLNFPFRKVNFTSNFSDNCT